MKQSFGSGRGSVYNIIMKSLQSGDKYGYEICQEIENKTNGNYILKQPSLYSGLKRLEAQKYVESYWGDSEIGGRRHYYRLTELGKQRLNSSNFSWEDERENFANDLFKKDEIDENLEQIKQEIQSTEQIVKQVQQTNDALSSAISKTNEEKQIDSSNIKKNVNSFSHKVNENQFDLFSFVEQTPAKEEQKEKSVNQQKELKEQKNTAIENEKIIEENEQSDIKTKQEELVKNDEDEILKNNFEDYFVQNKNSSFASSDFEAQDYSTSSDLEKSFTFYGAENVDNDDIENQDDDFEKRFAEFEKSFDENYEDTSNKSEKDIKQDDVNDDELKRLEQEKYMSDVLSGDFKQSQLENNDFDDNSKIQESHIEDDNFAAEEKENLDLKAIFGNLMEDETNKQSDLINSSENNLSQQDNCSEQKQQTYQDEMPRYDISDNINLSLSSQKNNYEYKNYQFENKEKIQEQAISYQTTNLTQNNTEKENKYEQNNLKKIEIRYLRKNNLENKLSNYVEINKVKFISASILSILSLILVLTGYFIVQNYIELDFVQRIFILIDIICIFVFSSIFYLKYAFDSHKKIKYNFSIKKYVLTCIISLALIGIVIGANVLLKMNFNNILFYYSTLIAPIIIVLCFSLFNSLNKILSKK